MRYAGDWDSSMTKRVLSPWSPSRTADTLKSARAALGANRRHSKIKQARLMTWATYGVDAPGLYKIYPIHPYTNGFIRCSVANTDPLPLGLAILDIMDCRKARRALC